MPNEKPVKAPEKSLNEGQIQQADRSHREKLSRYYTEEPKDTITISPMYEPYFGKVMTVVINGITIAVPCDGGEYKIPHTFASTVHQRIMAVDEARTRADRLADIPKNRDQYPGELKFV